MAGVRGADWAGVAGDRGTDWAGAGVGCAATAATGAADIRRKTIVRRLSM
jgi:hypothetical protein